LSYSRKDSSFLAKSTFLDFIKPLALSFGGKLYWDKDDHHSKWEEAIREALNETHVFLALVSQPFLTGGWTKREIKMAIKRQKKDKILIIPIMHSECQFHGLAWLKRNQRLPKNGKYIVDHGRRPKCFNEIAEDIRSMVIERYGEQSRTPPSNVQRRLTENDLKPVAGTLRQWAQQHAERLVPDPKTRENIIRAAEKIRELNGDRPLGKAQLEELDRKLVARGRRKPDPKYVRWVLRGKGLHPQGSYRSRD
jgi:hypothetical protein